MASSENNSTEDNKSTAKESSNDNQKSFFFGLPKNKAFNYIILIVTLILFIIIIAAVIVLIVVIVKNNKNKTNSNLNCRYGSQNNECIKCGLEGKSLKIVGGEQAEGNSWPSLALIWFDYKFDIDDQTYSYSTNVCGGTLINQDTILTAAHCFMTSVRVTETDGLMVELNRYHSTFESMYTIYLGAYDKTKLQNTTKMKVKSFILHPNYNDSNYLNDIAIIKLAQKVNVNQQVQIACVPNNSRIDYPNENVKAYIAGWGANDTDGTIYPDILKQAVITIYNSSMCKDVLNDLNKNWDKQICAGKYEGGVDSCQGDSGGPLYVKDQIDSSSRYVIAGVTSFGDKCGIKGKPGIYVRVSAYLDWIGKYW
ncbi:unnamed protein product [Brachionus calyciflorus]|uniref:Peptidase S1 domain-containing protein n=1 Tax=Brachionus calyciflorus TaxID=104777 RepID=A0A813UPM6_9BILA|nr:unnamed protein product [Brachionus calyciflorus]